MARDTSRPSDAAVDELFAHPEPVPLVYRRAFAGARTAVVLSGGTAVLAFVTGLSHLSQQPFELAGPLAGVVPAGAAEAMPLAEVLVAFALTLATVGLQRRYRLAWRGGLIACGALLFVPFLTGRATDVLVFALAAATIPTAAFHRDRFDHRVELTPFQTTALLAFVGVQVYGTVGTYAMRGNFVGVDSVTDAVYYVVVTGTTVGYGDATPTTQVTKLFTLSVIVLATASFTVATGSLVVPAIESRLTSAFENMNASERALLEDHVLVLGSGDLTAPLLDELDGVADVLVVTPDDDAASDLDARDVLVLAADPTDDDALRDARIDTARGVVVATDDDARDTLAILAARRANPDVRIVAAATEQRHAEALREVGADAVVTPAVVGGRLLGRSVLGADDDPFDGAASDE